MINYDNVLALFAVILLILTFITVAHLVNELQKVGDNN